MKKFEKLHTMRNRGSGVGFKMMEPKLKKQKSLLSRSLSNRWTDRKVKFFPDFEVVESEELSSSSSSEGRPKVMPDNAYWKDSMYYRLPENVRNAVDNAEMKSKHS